MNRHVQVWKTQSRQFFAVLLVVLCAPLLSRADAPAVIEGEYLMKVAGTRQRALTVQAQLGLQETVKNRISGSSLVEAAPGKKFDHELAKELIASGVIEYLEPNYLLSIHQTVPNDEQFAALWGLHNSGQTGGGIDVDVDAPEAWDLSTGDGSVVVGVVDTGVDFTHPDLASRMWVNPNETAGNGIDDDGNGVVDDVHGYDAITRSGNPQDGHGHGTHCAGTIAAAGNNELGVVGVAWNAKIMALKFLDASGSGATQDAIQAIEYAIRMKQAGVNLRVLSNSWGGGGYSQALVDAIQAAENAGILFVVAAGNAGNDNDFSPTYPASYEVGNILSVAALDAQGNLAGFSNYGAISVDVAAPGVSILSTKPGDSYQTLSGTSMAAPHVSGAAALLLSYDPSLTLAQLSERLLRTTKPISTLLNLTATGGMISAGNALRNIDNPAPPPDSLPGYRSAPVALAAAEYGSRVLTVDDGYAEVFLPFSFPYYQRTYTRLAVSANGRLIPLSEGESLPVTPDYTNRLTASINPFHDDLFPSPHSAEGGVWFAATNEEARVTWVVTHYGDRANASPTAEMRIQARIFADGRIEFHYLDTDAGPTLWSNGGSATIGLSPGTAVAGRNLLLTQNSPDAARFGSGRAIGMEDDGGNSDPGSPPLPPAPPSPLPSPVAGDIDGDGKRDITVWRPSTGNWYILPSAHNFDFAHHLAIQHGLPGDKPLLGDFDYDGRADLAVWRPSNGTWYLRLSATQFSGMRAIQWGLPGDTPFIGDYDGDGRDDLGVYRTSTGVFYVLKSETGYNSSSANHGDSASYIAMPLGGAGNDIVVGDFLGEGRHDFVTVWQLVRFWSVKDRSGALRFSLPWGYPGDTPLGCRFLSRSRDARVVVRVAPDYTLHWYSVDLNGAVRTNSFGSIGDTPSCEDQDGDGLDDLRVFRDRTAEWFIEESRSGHLLQVQFGLPGDVPL